jgi:hypothetical protein
MQRRRREGREAIWNMGCIREASADWERAAAGTGRDGCFVEEVSSIDAGGSGQ